MARPNGDPTQNSGTRKRMMQPVLPALPRMPKTKKEIDQPKAPELVPERDQAHNAVEPEAVQAQTTPVINGDKDVGGGEPGTASPETVDTLEAVELHEGSHKAYTPVAVVASNLEPTEEAIDKVPGDTLSQQGQLKIFSEETHDVIEPVAALSSVGQSGANSATVSPPAHDVYSMAVHAQRSDEDAIQNAVVQADTAPEPVTGNVETQTLTHRSAQPSISNSSIQRTPHQFFAVPTSPSPVISPQARDAGNNGHRSAPSFSTNGHGSPAERPDLSDEGLMPVNGQLNFPTIIEHIHSLQYASDLFDCEVCVYFPQSTKPVFFRSAHTLVLARSGRLRGWIGALRTAGYSYCAINLGLDKQIDLNAFDAALRFLYTDTLLSTDRLVPKSGTMDQASRIAAFEFAISYMIAGIELGVEPVVTTSLDAIGRIIDWDIAELVIKEATRLRVTSAASSSPHLPLHNVVVSKSIFQHVFNFIVFGLNVKQFKIDTTSSPTDMTNRLAYFEGGRAVNPALANMVFGSMPASSTSPTSPATSVSAGTSPDTVASIIMLNGEFEDLRDLSKGLIHVHGEDGVRVISEVVEERERRRTKIVNDRSISNQQRLANSTAWEVIGLREHVLDGVLRREHVGFLPPLRRGSKN